MHLAHTNHHLLTKEAHRIIPKTIVKESVGGKYGCATVSQQKPRISSPSDPLPRSTGAGRKKPCVNQQLWTCTGHLFIGSILDGAGCGTCTYVLAEARLEDVLPAADEADKMAWR